MNLYKLRDTFAKVTLKRLRPLKSLQCKLG